MKKILFIALLATATVVGYSQSVSKVDAVALQKARIAALDAQFEVAKAQYTAQRNMLVEGLNKIQAATNAPVFNSNPSSSSTSN